VGIHGLKGGIQNRRKRKKTTQLQKTRLVLSGGRSLSFFRREGEGVLKKIETEKDDDFPNKASRKPGAEP